MYPMKILGSVGPKPTSIDRTANYCFEPKLTNAARRKNVCNAPC